MLLVKRIYKSTGEEDFIAELAEADKKMLSLEQKYTVVEQQNGSGSPITIQLFLQLLQARKEYNDNLDGEYYRAGHNLDVLAQTLASVHFHDENATGDIKNLSFKLSQLGQEYETIGEAKRLNDKIKEYYENANAKPKADLRPAMTYGVVPMPAPVKKAPTESAHTIAAVQTYGVTPMPGEGVEVPLPKEPNDLDYALAYGKPIVKDRAKDYLEKKVVDLIIERWPTASKKAVEVILSSIVDGGAEIIAGSGAEAVLGAVGTALMEAIPVVGGIVVVASVIKEIGEELEKLHKRELLAKYGTTKVTRNGTLISMTEPKSRVEGSHWVRDKKTVGEPLKILTGGGWEEIPAQPGYSWDWYTKTLVPEWKLESKYDFTGGKPAYYFSQPQPVNNTLGQPFMPGSSNSRSFDNSFSTPDTTGYKTTPVPATPSKGKQPNGKSTSSYTPALIPVGQSQSNYAAPADNYTPASFDMLNHSLPLGQLNMSSPGNEEWRTPTWPGLNAPAQQPQQKKAPPSTQTIMPKAQIKGQQPITYNVTVKEVVGHKINTQHVNGTEDDVQMTGEQLTAILQQVVNAHHLQTA